MAKWKVTVNQTKQADIFIDVPDDFGPTAVCDAVDELRLKNTTFKHRCNEIIRDAFEDGDLEIESFSPDLKGEHKEYGTDWTISGEKA